MVSPKRQVETRLVLDQCEVYLSVTPPLEAKGFEARHLQTEEHTELSLAYAGGI